MSGMGYKAMAVVGVAPARVTQLACVAFAQHAQRG